MDTTDAAVTELMTAMGHEQVVFVADAPSRLRAVIAVHSTALGPSLGGIRFWRYPSEHDAVVDALRLSEAMSLKAAAAGLHQGGGKAVVLVDDPDAPRTDAVLRAMGRAIDDLGGRYIAAEDVGATPRDMQVIGSETPWVTGLEGPGGSGDPSPMTAYGVVQAMGAVLEELDGDAALAGKRVVVDGVGHVGTHLARLLAEAGARVAVADVNRERVEVLVREIGVERLPLERALEEDCDILAPCALGGVLNEKTIPRVQCRAVCGAANNQLADAAADDAALAGRGILYAPDFVVNAGGIINLAEEFAGYDRERARKHTAQVADTVRRVFELARTERVPPGRAAEQLARRRIAEEGAEHRFRPGDAAAWTSGAPLRTLRPS
ncbi:MAG TPA: Glu/Leu/Phe/Val dehydrogenase dimerization domain-containing protein [Acidimicrobiia bacterium]|nr:Glu/Leu/Phe/Val dehydrogenase dimerization domain-containing protein [Acidimicrobiia bacterium]